MNISFYSAVTGAEQQQRRLDVHGNNIANINNYGYRAERPSFEALMTGLVRGIEEDFPRGVGSRMVESTTDFNQINFKGTERKQDYAIEGHGFFALLDPVSGEYSYTRDGSFTISEFLEQADENSVFAVDEEGLEHKWYLSDGQGRFVLDSTGRPIEVLDDEAEQPVGVFDFINCDGMQHVGDNRFVPVEKNGQVRLGTGKVVQGYLELSNADLATELAKVIESQRSFSYMLKMVQASDEIETTVNGLRT